MYKGPPCTLQSTEQKKLSYMKFTGDRLRRWEKAKWGRGNLYDWIQSKMIDTFIFYIGGHKVVNSQQLT